MLCFQFGCLQDLFISKIEQTGGIHYADKMIKILSPIWMLGVIVLFAILGGLFGGLIRSKYNQKSILTKKKNNMHENKIFYIDPRTKIIF